MCLGDAGLATRVLTRLLVGVPAARLPESHQGSEVGSQHGPAEGGHRVDAHQAADEGVLAALEQGHDVGPHVVSVLLSEVLREKEGAGPKSYSTGVGITMTQFRFVDLFTTSKRNTAALPKWRSKSSGSSKSSKYSSSSRPTREKYEWDF